MKHTIATIILLTFVCFCNKANAQNEMYDSALARKLNADEYGMKYYVLVMLKKGSLQLTDTNKRDSIFRGHMHNIQRLLQKISWYLPARWTKTIKTMKAFLFLIPVILMRPGNG